MTKPWNVLWLMTDQHRADCLGCMGHPVVQTPNLDRIAAAGVVFENAFCQSPVCMASRGSLFTGRYPQTVRIRGMGVLPPQETTFPELLSRRGYRTGAFGKVHFTPEQYVRGNLGSDVPVLDWRRFADQACLWPVPDDPHRENYGFHEHVGCDDACQGLFQAWLREVKPELAGPDQPRSTLGLADLWVSPYPSEYHQSTFIAGSAEAFVRAQAQAPGGRPWFALCSFVAPHHPFEAPADQLARYDLQDMPLPDAEGAVDPAFLPQVAAEAVHHLDGADDDVRRRVIQHYLAAISLVDDNIGRLVSALEETGQLGQTLIVFLADHGEFACSHGLIRKPSIHYDELLRVPLLMRFPDGRAAGRRVSGMVELVDVVPTLTGGLGLEPHPGFQGTDWSDALTQGKAIGRDDIYADMFDLAPMVYARPDGPYTAVQTLRTRKWKLNLYPTHGREYGQLFDLENDPSERRNRYRDPACVGVREELMWRLLKRCHEQADPLPLRLTQW